jgi:asparagine N-glycosylation enzyme membrane subunit Stt3
MVKKRRIWMWVYASVFCGVIWGVWQAGIFQGAIYGFMVLIGGLLLEIYLHRKKKKSIGDEEMTK